MNINESLMTEQMFIDRIMRIIMNENDNMETGIEPNYDFWLFYKGFICEFVDEHHFDKEEYIMKDLLKKDLSHEQKNRIGSILMEHSEARKMIKRLDEIFGKTFGKNEKTLQGLKAIANVTKMYNNHSETSQKYLYSCMESMLTGKEHEKYEKMFLKRDGDIRYEIYAKNILYHESFYKQPARA